MIQLQNHTKKVLKKIYIKFVFHLLFIYKLQARFFFRNTKYHNYLIRNQSPKV